MQLKIDMTLITDIQNQEEELQLKWVLNNTREVLKEVSHKVAMLRKDSFDEYRTNKLNCLMLVKCIHQNFSPLCCGF